MENKKIIKENEFIEFYNSRRYEANCFNEDGSLNKNYNFFKSTGLIASIFEDHWKEVYFKNKKIIDCYNKDLGSSVYECPTCNDIIFVGHTCKSRFCSSCGYKYKNDRVENILQIAYNCQHRQIVFTIPKELRQYFFSHFEDKINLLFKAVRNTIYSILNESFKKNKKGKLKKYTSKVKYTPVFFAFLHTFGRDLKCNPHTHVLIAELKLGNNNSCIPWKFFNYDALSLRFKKILLDLLSKSFSNTKKLVYKNCPKGFYVYAEPKKFKNLKSGIEYVTRYCGRVPISENRIVDYDGTYFTFSYTDHKDNRYYQVKLHAHDFIMTLLRHLLPSQFKIIRYYNFYSFKHSIHLKMVPLIKEQG